MAEGRDSNHDNTYPENFPIKKKIQLNGFFQGLVSAGKMRLLLIYALSIIASQLRLLWSSVNIIQIQKELTTDLEHFKQEESKAVEEKGDLPIGEVQILWHRGSE